MHYQQRVSLQTLKKIKKAKTWPVPTNPKDFHSFLRLASHYHQFIPNFVEITKCLHQLVWPTIQVKGSKKNQNTSPTSQKIQWTGEHQKAFNLLKTCLTSVLELGYPDFSKPFKLESDTLSWGLSTALSQKDTNGQVHIIVCASRSFKPTE